MSTEKRLKKVKQLTKDYGEPAIEPFRYKASLLEYLNYHTLNTDDSTRKQWVEQWLQEKHPEVDLPQVHDREYRSFGMIARLVLIDSYIEDRELQFLEDELSRLQKLEESQDDNDEEDDDEKSDRREVLEKTFAANASKFIGEFEGLVDEFTSSWSSPNIQALVTTMGVSNRVAPRIIDYAKKKNEYYLSVIDDKEAFESYSFTRPQLRKIAGLYEELITKLSQAKKVRAPRKRKEKPAGVLVQGMKYKQEDAELGLKSVHPTQLIGATEAYLFRTDRRKLQYFKAVDGQTLTVKGTTILNYDEEKSFEKTIRKPELIKNFVGKGKVDSRRYTKEFNSTEGNLSGRTSDETIIVSVFK